jgi:hypothetical protein
MGAHRSERTGTSVELGQPRERVRHALERQRERDDAAAVHTGRDRGCVDLGSCGHLGEQLPLAWVPGKAVARGWPSARPAEREDAGVLP